MPSIPGTLVANLSLDAINNRAPSCTAALYYSSPYAGRGHYIGTGTLLRHGKRVLLLTCEHVATEFASSPDACLVLGTKSRLKVIKRQFVSLWRRCKKDDIALLEVDASQLTSNLIPRSLDEFLLEGDLSGFDHGKHGFALVGFPAAMIETNPVHGIHTRFNALAYGTVNYSRKRGTKTSVYLEYPDSGDPATIPPKPYGLSGAAIVALEPMSKQSKRLWKFGKIVAVQSSAVEGKYLRGRTIRMLSRWLN